MTQIIVPSATPGREHRARHQRVGRSRATTARSSTTTFVCPSSNQLGSRGSGHQAAQDRLGAGRIYHCMNSIGQMWRAFDLMVERAMAREVHGGLLETKQFIQGFIADSYMDIQAARLMTIHCAEKMAADVDPRTDISAIKVFVPAAYDAGRRPCDPGVGRGGRVGRPAPRRDVPGGAHAAHRRRSRRGAQDPHRQERALAVSPRRRAGTSAADRGVRGGGRQRWRPARSTVRACWETRHLLGGAARWLRPLVREAGTRERGEALAEPREALGLRAGRAALAGQRVDTV